MARLKPNVPKTPPTIAPMIAPRLRPDDAEELPEGEDPMPVCIAGDVDGRAEEAALGTVVDRVVGDPDRKVVVGVGRVDTGNGEIEMENRDTKLVRGRAATIASQTGFSSGSIFCSFIKRLGQTTVGRFPG